MNEKEAPTIFLVIAEPISLGPSAGKKDFQIFISNKNDQEILQCASSRHLIVKKLVELNGYFTPEIILFFEEFFIKSPDLNTEKREALSKLLSIIFNYGFKDGDIRELTEEHQEKTSAQPAKEISPDPSPYKSYFPDPSSALFPLVRSIRDRDIGEHF